MIMATLVITIGNDDCVNEGINIICNQCRPIYMNEDNKIRRLFTTIP